MSYLALYRKYRPSNFADLVGQSDVVNVIKNEILNDKISHAYLFSGPRGTGKTSTAKIISKMINCSNLSVDGNPCGQCLSCINFSSSSDIIEIDAASNNGVDEIRELRDKVNMVPAFGKYRVYIIDEVHMLTTQAFNALLKTLEEPPSHIIFILATTEFYKIPTTVVSRCQKFQFLKFSIDDIVSRLKYICSNESISVSNDVLYEIARLSDGGMRDAINMLDQVSSFSDGNISVDDIYQLNGVVSFLDFSKLFDYLLNDDVLSIIHFIENIDQSGKNMERFVNDFITFIKDILIYKTTNGNFDSGIVEKNDCLSKISSLYCVDFFYKMIISLNDLSIRIKNSSFVKILLITEFVHFCDIIKSDSDKIFTDNNELISDDKKNSRISNAKNDSNYLNDSNKNNVKVTKITDKEKSIRINNTFATASKELKENFVNNWNDVSDKLANDDNFSSIALMMNDISIMVVGKNNVIFVAKYDSLIDRLFEQIDVIERLLFDVYHTEYRAVFLVEDEWKYLKEKYITNLKSGYVYKYIDSSSLSSNSISDDDVDKIISFFGNDIISYE